MLTGSSLPCGGIKGHSIAVHVPIGKPLFGEQGLFICDTIPIAKHARVELGLR
ncbi:hypothetical protein HRbin20_01574 [bacterium HR20]|nr:hypothetical protein HRbin20_01574 [bacterium HR20]